MKQLIIFFSLLFVLISFTACQNEGKKAQVEANEPVDTRDHEKIKAELLADLEPTPEEKRKNLLEKRGHASALIDKRIKEEGAYSMLTAFYYEWEFVFNGKSITKEGKVAGYWFKFEDDFTYQYGVYDEVKGSGRYHLKLDGLQLMMLDNEPTKMPQEFQLLTKEDVIVFVGKDYFENNPKQIKTNKAFERPSNS